MTSAYASAADLLLAELRPSRKTTIIDVGANPINAAPYADLLQKGGCHVIGFEPQADAFARLKLTKGSNETYYPFAVGTGEPQDLRIYRSSGMTSIFDPYLPGLRSVGMRSLGKVKEKIALDTVALDATADLPAFDLMKIDIQGGEALVFQGAERVMADCVAVIVELRYMRIYLGEPMVGGIDTELRRQGFYLHKFMFNMSKMLRNSQSDRLDKTQMADQLIDGDAIYLRNIAEPELLSTDQLKHLAILGGTVFDSHSLVLYCLDALVDRKAVSKHLPGAYVDLLPAQYRLEAQA